MRRITYWGQIKLFMHNLHFGSGDTAALKILTKEKGTGPEIPIPEIAIHFKNEFERLFGDLPYHDVDEGRSERWEKDYLEHKMELQNFDASSQHERFEALEEIRRNALYGPAHSYRLYTWSSRNRWVSCFCTISLPFIEQYVPHQQSHRHVTNKTQARRGK